MQYVTYPIDKNKLYRNRWMFIEEGLNRGYDIKKTHPKKLIFHVEKDGQGFIYDTLPGAITARMRFPYIANKIYQKEIMGKAGICVAKTFAIIRKNDDFEKVMCEFPCVVKPAIGSRSKNVAINIQTKDDLHDAITEIKNANGTAIVEKNFFGNEYRALVVNGKFVSCVQRRPASIVGDGEHTIEELINIKNSDPERGPRSSMTHTLHHIVIDDVVHNTLKKMGLTLGSVLDKDDTFSLTTKINTSVGADLVDHTKGIHPKFVNLCEQFAQKYNFFIIGFDVIAQDIAVDPDKQEYIFNELNEQPFFDISEKCNIEKGAPVASMIWDAIEQRDIMTKEFLVF